MSTLRLTGIVLAAVAIGIAIGFLAARLAAIDGCKDRGGMWNRQYGMCDVP